MARLKTKSASDSVSAYIKKTYDRIEVKVPKETAALFRASCDAEGTNPNRLINQWIAQHLSAPVE